jgi:hypothetical protein
MLKTDPSALRFWGLSLRSRTMRRLVVTLTYAVYVIGMADQAGAGASQRIGSSKATPALSQKVV